VCDLKIEQIIFLQGLKNKEEALKILKDLIGPSVTKPLTVAVIGTPGVGKSCFINTMITSMIGEYREWCKTGDSEGAVTYRLTS
jgi:ribosome biogenesis GTPase A